MDGCYESDWDTLWWDVIQIIITHSPEVPTDRRNVVRLRRVGQGTILVKTNALRSEGIEFRLNGRISWIGGKRRVGRCRCLTVESAVEKSVFSSQI